MMIKKDDDLRYECNSDNTNGNLLSLRKITTYHFTNKEVMSFDTTQNSLLLYTISGSGNVRLGNTCTSLQAQSLLFLEDNTPYECCCQDTGWDFLLLEIDNTAIYSYRAYLPNYLLYPIPLSSSIPHTLERLQTCYLQSASVASPEIALRSTKYLTDILTELALYQLSAQNASIKVPAYIREMKHMFDTDYGRDYSLDQLEAYFSISKYRLCREFSKYCQISPLQYLNQVRITAAKELLLTSNLLIHEVGSHVGIDNTNHFINLFKKNTGVTPLVFRQSAPVLINDIS